MITICDYARPRYPVQEVNGHDAMLDLSSLPPFGSRYGAGDYQIYVSGKLGVFAYRYNAAVAWIKSTTLDNTEAYSLHILLAAYFLTNVSTNLKS